MATQTIPDIINHTVSLDAGIYPAKVNDMMTVTNGGEDMCIVMADGGAVDVGLNGSFVVPTDYAGSPVLLIRGVIDAAATPTGVLAFGMNILGRSDSELYDTAKDGEDTASISTWTGYIDEDYLVLSMTLSTPTLVAGESVNYEFYLDDSALTYAGNFLLKSLGFQYSDV